MNIRLRILKCYLMVYGWQCYMDANHRQHQRQLLMNVILKRQLGFF